MAGVAVSDTRSAWQRVARQLPGQVAIVAFAVAGLGISIYLTLQHYVHVPLICSASGLVDCASVLTSPYSVVPGTTLPITLPGMLWCVASGGVAMTSLALAWRRMAVPARLFLFQKIWGGIGLLSIFYLIYAEIVKLHHLCAWCTGVHALVLATFLVTLGSDPVAATKPAPATRKPASAKASQVAAKPAASNASAATKTSASTKSPVTAAATKPATRPVGARGAKSAATGATRKSGAKSKSRAAAR